MSEENGKVEIKGTLEIFSKEGIIYFHNEADRTILRIKDLPSPINLNYIKSMFFLDVNVVKANTNWKGLNPE